MSGKSAARRQANAAAQQANQAAQQANVVTQQLAKETATLNERKALESSKAQRLLMRSLRAGSGSGFFLSDTTSGAGSSGVLGSTGVLG